MARNFQIVLAFRCGSLKLQGTVPLGEDRPISGESAHTTPTAGETAVAPALGAELVKGSAPRAVLCCSGPWVSDLKKHALGKAQGNSQQALGAAQGWLGGHRDTSRGELSPLPAALLSPLGREGEAEHLRKLWSPHSTTLACVRLS